MMKKMCMLIIPLALAAALVAAGCGGGGVLGNSPQDAVNGFWDAYTKADFERAAQFVTSDRQDEVRRTQHELESDGFMGKELFTAMMGQFKIKTTGHNIDGDTATVDAVLTLPDLGYVMGEIMGAMFEIMMDEELDEAEAEQKMMELFMEALSEAEIVEMPATLDLVKEDGEWKLAHIFDLGEIMEEF